MNYLMFNNPKDHEAFIQKTHQLLVISLEWLKSNDPIAHNTLISRIKDNNNFFKSYLSDSAKVNKLSQRYFDRLGQLNILLQSPNFGDFCKVHNFKSQEDGETPRDYCLRLAAMIANKQERNNLPNNSP